MPREVIEYRAVGEDTSGYREAEEWHEDRARAERDLARLRAWNVALAFDATFLERRVSVLGGPERVGEEGK